MRHITRDRFTKYEKIRQSGKRNMFGYNIDIQTRYDQLYKHFIEEKKEEPYSY